MKEFIWIPLVAVAIPVLLFVSMAWWEGWDDFTKTPTTKVEVVHNQDGSTCYITHGGFNGRAISCVEAK